METEDSFLYTYFTLLSQTSYDKAKEHVEKEKETSKFSHMGTWGVFLSLLQQLIITEKSYIDLGFLQTKNKGFLRKDNSLKSIYETLKSDVKKLEHNCNSLEPNQRIQLYCPHIFQLLSARVNMIELYERIYNMSTTNIKFLTYEGMYKYIDNLIEKHALEFTNISFIPIKAVFNMEIEILQHLFKALAELQMLQFLPSLALIHGANTRLTAWDKKLTANRETWKINFLKNNPSPALIQWMQKFKGSVLSKFSLFFHETLAKQTTPADMRHQCARLQHDHYHKIVSFHRKYEAACVILLSDNQVNCDTTDYDSFPIIVSYPPRSPPQLETILKMISDMPTDEPNVEKIVYKFSSMGHCTYVLVHVEPNIYLVIVFESKKTEKDAFISTFISEMVTNLRCSKIFASLKYVSK